MCDFFADPQMSMMIRAHFFAFPSYSASVFDLFAIVLPSFSHNLKP